MLSGNVLHPRAQGYVLDFVDLGRCDPAQM